MLNLSIGNTIYTTPRRGQNISKLNFLKKYLK